MAVIGAKLRAPCCPRRVLLAARVVVERLVKTCAHDGDTGDGDDRTPGVSLAKAMEIAESLGDSPGSTAVVETCVAFHIHLLEWLAVLEGGVDDTTAVEGSNRLAASDGSVWRTLSSEFFHGWHVFAS